MTAPVSAAVKPTPDIALEMAVVDALIQGLGLKAHECERRFSGEPGPTKGDLMIAVWSRNELSGDSRTCLDVSMGCFLTISLKGGRRARGDWAAFRADLSRLAWNCLTLLHKDSWDHRVVRAANALAGLEPMDGITTTSTKRVGFVRGLAFQRSMGVEAKGAGWWGGSGDGEAGLASTLAFDGARLIMATPTAG